MIFNIQKCSIHDGNGLRTLVFLKGCPLHCLWCANPESQSYKPEIMENMKKCIGCGACIKACPNQAIHITDQGPIIDRQHCVSCGKCADICYAGAKYVMGEEMAVEEVFRQIKKDEVFYSIKGGGVTFSGGEPLTDPEFLTAILKRCHEARINTAMESCGMGDYEKFKSALPYLDSCFLDIKHIDSARHRELTGAGNELILSNIRKIAEAGVPVTIRTPIIPGCNDSVDNITGIAEFIATLPNVVSYELLPYHEFGKNKYHMLGRDYPLEGTVPPSDDAMDELVMAANDILNPYGTYCFYTKDNCKKIVRRDHSSDPEDDMEKSA